MKTFEQFVYNSEIEKIENLLSNVELYNDRNLFNDLLNVGTKKLVGYLPLSTIEKYGGMNAKNLLIKWAELSEYESSIKDYKDGFCCTSSGALYIYDKPNLQKFLDKYSEILKKANVPIDADEYIDYIEYNTIQNEKFPEAYKIIGMSFNDKRWENLNYTKTFEQFVNDLEIKPKTKYLSKDGFLIIVGKNSHLHGEIVNILPDIIGKLECDNRYFISEQIDFPYEIGKTTCVKVDDNDEIIYALRIGRKGYTKFVKNREPEPTNSATIVLKKTNNIYIIITAYIGTQSEVEPWDRHATEKSIEFWNNHALIFGTQEIIPNSEIYEN